MKTRLCILGIVLISFGCGSVNAQEKCTLNPPSDLIQKPFPDIFNMSVLSYQLQVELTYLELGQTNFYTEYYDITNKKGRVDVQREGKGTEIYYYFHDTKDAFSLRNYTCKSERIASIPEFLNAQYTWLDYEGEREVYGPSAMLRIAYLNQQKNKTSVKFMGDYFMGGGTVRGLKSQYWASCLTETLRAEYYFTDPDHEDAYGFEDLAVIPLRIVVGGVDKAMNKQYLPQNYEFMSFQPYVSDIISVFELPVGAGCDREDSDDYPDLPSFTDKSIQFYAEAIYRYREDEVHSYNSNFMLSLDLPSSHLAYFYTPWGKLDKTLKKQTPGFPIFVVYDMKNEIAYERDFIKGTCKITRTSTFSPIYELPAEGGYVNLTDPSILFTNNEFKYIADGKTRGLDVHIFEGVTENYNLGSRQIPRAAITHYYLRDSEVEMTNVAVRNALVRTRLSFTQVDKSQAEGEQIQWLGTLNINFFGFSTQVENKNRVFDVTACFPNDDDSMYAMVGFNADPSDIEKIRSQVPIIEENFFSMLSVEAGIPPVRVPKLLIDFADGLFITMVILQRPPIMVDFDSPIEGVTIDGTPQGIPQVSEDGCGLQCLESDEDCWGFALCKATCYLGTGTEKNTKADAECTVRKRINMASNIPSMEIVANNIKRLVDEKRMKLEIPVESQGEPIQLESNYFESFSAAEADDLTNNMGKDLNPRMRVLKLGSKLDSAAGSAVKNLGSLSFDQCQKICLDYKTCETVSYCHNTRECITSLSYGENIPDTQIKKDYFCTILTRKYGDQFERTAGITLSKNAEKTVSAANVEDCARQCATEKSFTCLSFDHCSPNKDPTGCRLHKVHYLDVKNQESSVTSKSVCGHYSRKYSYEFKREAEKITTGSGINVASGITQEDCAKRCVENTGGVCYGFDFCQDKSLTSTTCTLMNQPASKSKTAYSSICTHFTRDIGDGTTKKYSNSLAGGLGFLFFIIGGVIGAVIVFIVAYLRVNKSS